jgi:hypothetical protein
MLPTLPQYISNIMTNLDAVFSISVMPVDNPTVPMADKLQKKRWSG